MINLEDLDVTVTERDLDLARRYRYDLVGDPYEAPEPGYLARLR